MPTEVVTDVQSEMVPVPCFWFKSRPLVNGPPPPPGGTHPDTSRRCEGRNEAVTPSREPVKSFPGSERPCSPTSCPMPFSGLLHVDTHWSPTWSIQVTAMMLSLMSAATSGAEEP